MIPVRFDAAAVPTGPVCATVPFEASVTHRCSHLASEPRYKKIGGNAIIYFDESRLICNLELKSNPT